MIPAPRASERPPVSGLSPRMPQRRPRFSWVSSATRSRGGAGGHTGRIWGAAALLGYSVRVARLFVPQSKLEEWALGDKADIRDGKLVVSAEKASYPVHPAVHFSKLVSGADDKKLLRKVKTQEELHKLGAEHMAESVLVG